MRMTRAIRRTSCLAAILAAAALLLPAGSRADEASEKLYKTKCAACHGADGKGETTMGKTLKVRDLASTEVQKQSDGELNGIITKGKNKMPSFDSKLKKEEVAQLVAYIRELGKKH